jgi:uroporphyrinogen-III synthase
MRRRPLEGRTVVITASRRATEQASLVSRLGGSPYVVPTVGISLTPDEGEVERFLRSIIREGVDFAVFMTGPGVQALMLMARKLLVQEALVGTLNSERTTVVARSGKPKEVLVRFGIEVDALPPRDQATAAGIVALLRERDLSRKRVAILWHGAHTYSMREELLSAGVESVLECSTYAYSHQLDSRGAGVLKDMGFSVVPPSEEAVLRLIGEIIGRERVVDAMTFTSPPAARHFFEVAAQHGMVEDLKLALNEGVCIAAVGPSTKVAVEDRGVKVHVVPQLQAMGAMITALAEYFEKRIE